MVCICTRPQSCGKSNQVDDIWGSGTEVGPTVTGPTASLTLLIFFFFFFSSTTQAGERKPGRIQAVSTNQQSLAHSSAPLNSDCFFLVKAVFKSRKLAGHVKAHYGVALVSSCVNKQRRSSEVCYCWISNMEVEYITKGRGTRRAWAGLPEDRLINKSTVAGRARQPSGTRAGVLLKGCRGSVQRGGAILRTTLPFKVARRADWSGWSLWCRGCEHKKGQTHKDAPDDKLSYSFKSPQQQNRWIYGRSPWPGRFRANKNHSSKPVIDFSRVEMAARLFWTFSC